MKKTKLRYSVMTIFISFLIILGIGCYLLTPKFGSLPDEKSLELIKKSKNYKNGRFQNLNPTPQMSEGTTLFGAMLEYLFVSHPNTKPSKPIPSIKTDLKNLDPSENVLVWFGHSSYFVQQSGKTFLVDPVFSKTASPIPFNVMAFKGTEIYQADDMPDIDYLIISHDHWDHVDYPTIIALKNRVKKVICGLGVGAHFRRWGFADEKIVEMDWFEKEQIGDVVINAFPARHFSGRGLVPNKSLWMSFVVETKDYTFYIGGDSGYDDHYKKIGDSFQKIDLALLDSGQYDKSWKYIHENPSEVIKAMRDLKASALLPVHHSKFTISNHPWNEPLIELSKDSKGEDFNLFTPMIGEKIDLTKKTQSFKQWWID